MTELSHTKEVASPKEQVERVVTALWEHPLLDDATLAHRKAALLALPAFFREFDIDESEYVGILKGSSQRIVDETSDYDFTIIKPNPISSFDDKFSNARDAEQHTQPRIDVFAIQGISPDNPNLAVNAGFTMTQLLFTPDEYLVGNIDLAHQYRRNIIDQLEHDPKSKRLFWGDGDFEGSLPAQFSNCFKEWGIAAQSSRLAMKFSPNHRELAQNRLKKEQARLDANIKKRAAISNNPRWEDDFRQAINDLQPPSFEAYKTYLELTDGAVHIDQRFAAQNLTTN